MEYVVFASFVSKRHNWLLIQLDQYIEIKLYSLKDLINKTNTYNGGDSNTLQIILNTKKEDMERETGDGEGIIDTISWLTDDAKNTGPLDVNFMSH